MVLGNVPLPFTDQSVNTSDPGDFARDMAKLVIGGAILLAGFAGASIVWNFVQRQIGQRAGVDVGDQPSIQIGGS